MAVCDPTLDVERVLIADGAPLVIGCDEVGRGAVAGPVAVGMAVVDSGHVEFPTGLRDSKMLSEKKRTALAPVVTEWARATSVGLATPQEIDVHGISAALGIAAKRALIMLHDKGIDIVSAIVLLDGNRDYLSPVLQYPLDVRTRVKGDRDCASIAAASVVAKVERDALMILEHATNPVYAWEANKGYGSAAHMSAIREVGLSALHRRTWLTEHVG
ncbi:ribonuclease HII [Paramicrobacterium sp. CJ85]|uniref:ribonuclease HII n=1 Tax=Paramicrobacterium sp. CJ85 TaxID=3445355 RepID=UPI003F60A739